MGRLVAIDPGVNHTGVAFFNEHKLVKIKLIKRVHKDLATNAQHQAALLYSAVMSAGGVNCVVVEMPRIYPKSKARPNDIIDLTYMTGILAGAALRFFYPGVEAITVYPRTWKGNVPKDIHNKKILAKLPGLEEQLTKIPKSKREHVIDAAGIGLWAIERGYHA